MTVIQGELPYAVAVWILVSGLYGIVTSRNLVHMVMCVAVAQSSTYLLLLGIGYRRGGIAPVFLGPQARRMVDPVTQALCLTDVVVEATVMALLLALVVQVHRRTGLLDPDRLREMRG